MKELQAVAQNDDPCDWVVDRAALEGGKYANDGAAYAIETKFHLIPP
jgi:hypothetical protein